MDKYLVTCASGNIGKYVVEELLSLNKDIKAAVHNIEKAKGIFNDTENLEIVKFDFLDMNTFDKALQGVRAIFLVRPPELADPQKDMLPFLETVKEKKIEKIVFVSLLGVEKNPIVPHRKIEDMIKKIRNNLCIFKTKFFHAKLEYQS